MIGAVLSTLALVAGCGGQPVTYVEFPGTGHMVRVEDPEGLSGAIGD